MSRIIQTGTIKESFRPILAVPCLPEFSLETNETRAAPCMDVVARVDDETGDITSMRKADAGWCAGFRDEGGRQRVTKAA